MSTLAVISNPSYVWNGHSIAEVSSWVAKVMLKILQMEIILGYSALYCSYTALNICECEYWFCDIEKLGYIAEWKKQPNLDYDSVCTWCVCLWTLAKINFQKVCFC